jgi:hypothetical protein
LPTYIPMCVCFMPHTKNTNIHTRNV